MSNNNENFTPEIDEMKELGEASKFVKNLLTLKNPDDMLKDASKGGLKKTLNAFDLIILGVGAIIGSGIFTVVGIAAQGAGPSLVISMILASFACIFSALCYSEFASMIPVAGSAYIYTYATMGEFMAWMIGWILMLEYLVAYVAVVSAWSGYFMQFIQGFQFLPHWLTNPPIYLIHDYSTVSAELSAKGMDIAQNVPHIFGIIPFCINIPGILMTLYIIYTLIKGIKESTKMAGVMVAIKLGVVGLFILAGMFYVKPTNWVPFMPNGASGMFMSAFIIFFAYIGFDAIATAAEETKNPQKNIPIGIIGSLLICTIVYVLVALVLTGIVPMDILTGKIPMSDTLGTFNIQAPIASAMTMVGKDWIAGLISIGALTGLTSVLLVMMLAGTRILYAMSRDGFLPKILQAVHSKFKTPHVLTLMVGTICILGMFVLDIDTAATLCNYGTFASFIIVCIAVLILRKTQPERHRPFKVPFSPFLPAMGIITCGSLMLYSMNSLPLVKKLLFPAWIVMGIAIYFLYGYHKLRTINKESQEETNG